MELNVNSLFNILHFNEANHCTDVHPKLNKFKVKVVIEYEVLMKICAQMNFQYKMT